MPGRAQQPCALWGRTFQATEPQLAVASRQQQGKGSAPSFPAPSLAVSPALCFTLGPGGGPLSQRTAPSSLLARPVQESSQESAGRQPQGPRPLCTPALWPAPVYSVPVYVGLTV